MTQNSNGTFNPHDHLITIRAKDGSQKPYLPAAWRLYELALRYPNANFSSEILLLDVDRNLVVVKCRLYLGASYEQSEKKTEALKSGPLSALDKVETAAKARCARDFGISTELALEWDESEVATNDAEELTATVKALQLEAKSLGLASNKEQWMAFKRQVLGASVINANLQAHQIAQLGGAIEAHKRGMPQPQPAA